MVKTVCGAREMDTDRDRSSRCAVKMVSWFLSTRREKCSSRRERHMDSIRCGTDTKGGSGTMYKDCMGVIVRGVLLCQQQKRCDWLKTKRKQGLLNGIHGNKDGDTDVIGVTDDWEENGGDRNGCCNGRRCDREVPKK